MREPFAEYRAISGSEPLRQGDVLEAVDVSASKWQRHLFVITADCDFAYRKHRGRVTCIPLLTADEYLLEMQLPRVRERLAKKPLAELQEILMRTAGPRISEQRLREWACEADAGAIIPSLMLRDADAVAARRALECLRLLDAPVDNLKDAATAFVEAQMSGPQSQRKRENAVKAVQSALREPYAQPPGDALFLSTFAPAHDRGYFAYLRHLEQVWEPDISTGPSHRAVKYRRVARLQDRFIHALVQRFAMVFMPIGLPPAYEETRDLYSELIGDSFK